MRSFWMFLKQCHSPKEVFQTPQEEDRDRRFGKEEHLKNPRSPHLLSFPQLQIPSPSSPTDCLHQNFWVEASKFIMSTPPPTQVVLMLLIQVLAIQNLGSAPPTLQEGKWVWWSWRTLTRSCSWFRPLGSRVDPGRTCSGWSYDKLRCGSWVLSSPR